MTETTTAALADPITTEIIRNAFVSCAQDMNATLIRSSYTPIIYEGKDCSVAILDEHGDVLGQSLGLPLFLGNLEICVKLAADLFGWDTFEPGDVFYYRLQSPVLIAELDHHCGVFLDYDTPKPFHVHTVLRTPHGNDYGRAWVRQWQARNSLS